MFGMAFPNYTPERRQEVADLLKCHEQYLYQILTGRKTPSAGLARSWNTLDPKVMLQDLLPKEWKVIWPELATPQNHRNKAA